jgi:hypothetical protein
VGKTDETIPGKSPKVAFFARNGGSLFPEWWLFKNGMGGFFAPDYAHPLSTIE